LVTGFIFDVVKSDDLPRELDQRPIFLKPHGWPIRHGVMKPARGDEHDKALRQTKTGTCQTHRAGTGLFERKIERSTTRQYSDRPRWDEKLLAVETPGGA
jgi:hypothetical protein